MQLLWQYNFNRIISDDWYVSLIIEQVNVFLRRFICSGLLFCHIIPLLIVHHLLLVLRVLVNISKTALPIPYVVYLLVVAIVAHVRRLWSVPSTVVESVHSSIRATLNTTSSRGDSVGSLLHHVLLRPWHLLNQVTWDRLISVHSKTLLLVVKCIDVVVNVQIPLCLVLGSAWLLRSLCLVVALPLEITWLIWFSREHSYLLTLVILGSCIHLVRLHRWLHFLVHLVLSHLLLLT